MTSRSILIVDDDEDLCSALVEQFNVYEEFQASHEGTAGKAIQTVRAGIVDLLVMDVALPDMDGRDAVKILRRGGYKGPIIMLTARDSDSDTILGLEAGANDYVTKPFRFAVLLARIRAQLREYEHTEDVTFSMGPYTFKPGKKLLINEHGSKIRLTDKETAIIIVPTRRWLGATYCSKKSGVTTRPSPPTHWRLTSIDYAKRSRTIHPMPTFL